MEILWKSAMAKIGKHILIMKMVLWTTLLVMHKSGKRKDRQLRYQTGKRGIVGYPKLDIMWQRAVAKLGKHILIMAPAV
jgi:hypothetical protein